MHAPIYTYPHIICIYVYIPPTYKSTCYKNKLIFILYKFLKCVHIIIHTKNKLKIFL